MPEPVAEPALNGLRLNLRIVSVVIFNFASYLTIACRWRCCPAMFMMSWALALSGPGW